MPADQPLRSLWHRLFPRDVKRVSDSGGTVWVCRAGHHHVYRRNAITCNEQGGGIS